MAWFETLPENCPPSEAVNPTGQTFYRICGNPVSEEDFYSHKRLYPNKQYSHSQLCEANGLSILESLEVANNFLKMPTFKSRNLSIGELVLKEKDGVVLQTGRNVSHFTWWLTNDFDFSRECKLIG